MRKKEKKTLQNDMNEFRNKKKTMRNQSYLKNFQSNFFVKYFLILRIFNFSENEVATHFFLF
jgi:hypothetical protein